MAEIEIPIDDATPFVVEACHCGATEPTFFEKWKKIIGGFSIILLLVFILVPISIGFSKSIPTPTKDLTEDPRSKCISTSDWSETYTFTDNSRVNFFFNTSCIDQSVIVSLDGKRISMKTMPLGPWKNTCQTGCFDTKNGTSLEIIHCTPVSEPVYSFLEFCITKPTQGPLFPKTSLIVDPWVWAVKRIKTSLFETTLFVHMKRLSAMKPTKLYAWY